MPAFLKSLLPIVLLAAVAACSDAGATAEADAELRRELDAAKLEMRPAGQRIEVVGAVEQVPQAAAAPTAPQKREVARRSPRQARRPAAPVPQVASAPEPVEAEEVTFEPVPAARRPVQPSTPPISPPPPGGYKSVNEVMRSAPFPINP